MDLTKILSISGKPGLYKIISQTKNNTIVESLIDGKRFPAYPSQKISILEEIAIFTTGEEIPLIDVLKLIYNKTQKKEVEHDIISDNLKLKSFFEEILPEYDKERVYVSDMKKVISWYNILLKNNILDFETQENSENSEPNNNEEKTEEQIPQQTEE
jgi:hypothetical protein